MWILCGSIAVIATFTNLYRYRMGKDYQLAMAIALAFTAFTLVAQYQMVSDWVQTEDWTALFDVVPTMKFVLWGLTGLSIMMNMLPILFELKQNKRSKICEQA